VNEMEQATLTRREFSKGLLASLALLCVQPLGDDQITIKDVVFEDGWESLLTIQPSKDPHSMLVTFDAEKWFQYVALVDDKGRRWHSYDGGTTWRNGFGEFSMER
jgi:hypothetical protein